MGKKLIFDTEYAYTYEVPELKLVEIHWKDAKINSEAYRKTFEDAFEYVVNNNIELWHFLSDTTDQNIISPEDRKWFQNTMVPKVDEYGLKKAVVLSRGGDPFKKYYLNMILRWINRNMNMRMKVFNSEEKAYEWFKESFKK